MRITRLETFHLHHRLSRRRGPSILSYDARETLLVKLSTDQGLTGWGETYAVAGVRGALEAVGPSLIGRDPLASRAIGRVLAASTFGNGFARGALDIAVHDIRGQALGLPAYRVYGEAVRERVPAYASLPGYEDHLHPSQHWSEEAEALVARGFRAMKLRIGRFPPREELPAVERVMAGLPAGVRLMADGNAAYTLPTAVAVGEELARMGLAWFEEPLSQWGYHGYPELRRKLRVALAGGEGTQDRAACDALLRAGGVDIIQPDVSICAGMAEVLFVAELAQLHGVQCIPHCWGGAVMLAATAHVVAALPEPSRLPGNEPAMVEVDVTENPFRDELLEEPLELGRDGQLALPQAPGLGIRVREDVVQRYAVDA